MAVGLHLGFSVLWGTSEIFVSPFPRRELAKFPGDFEELCLKFFIKTLVKRCFKPVSKVHLLHISVDQTLDITRLVITICQLL